MKLEVTIKSVKAKPFTNDDGDVMDYYWYRAERSSDQVSFQFGSQYGDHPIGEAVTLELEKYEKANGKIGYKELRATTATSSVAPIS